MTCYSPLKGFQIGLYPSGKPRYKICSWSTDHVEINLDESVSVCFTKRRGINCKKSITEYVEIPCGHCTGCRLDYSRQWADRCLLEMKEHESTFFVTLTYDDEHITDLFCDSTDADTGEYYSGFSLRKKDVQLFYKRLRRSLDSETHIRYFTCGEYGDITHRPHYHAIIFGLKIPDLRVYKKNTNGNLLYNSAWLEEIWSNGFVVIAPATWETCAYTARYVMKKQFSSNAVELYDKRGLERPFTLMSRKPGIGRNSFDREPKIWFDRDFVSISTESGERQIRPSRYFKKLFSEMEPDLYEVYKNKTAATQHNMYYLQLEQTSDDYETFLKKQGAAKESVLKSLKRNSF